MDSLDNGCFRRRPPPPGFGPFPGGDLLADHPLPHGLGLFNGSDGAMHAPSTGNAVDAFFRGVGLGLACPPPAFWPSYGGVETMMNHVNLLPLHRPRTAGYRRWRGRPVHTNPGFALAPRHDQFAGSRPFGGGALNMYIPSSWEPYFVRHTQPRCNEPVPLPPAPPPSPVVDGSITNNAETFPAEPHVGDEIDAVLRAMEQRAEEQPSPDYLATTQNGRMVPRARASLVRFMGRIAWVYGLVPGTFHRAVSYFDRFLSARPLPDVGRRRLRILGAAAVFAAAKHEEQGAMQKVNAQLLAEVCCRCLLRGPDSDPSQEALDAAKRALLDTERTLLAALDHRLGAPTSFTFVERFTEHYGDGLEDQVVRLSAHYFVEVALRDYGCLKLKPSAVAAAAIFLARLALKPSYGQVMRWNRELWELTGYKPMDLQYAVVSMCSLMDKMERDRSGFDVVIFPMFFADPS